jgi:hypothetical protein
MDSLTESISQRVVALAQTIEQHILHTNAGKQLS